MDKKITQYEMTANDVRWRGWTIMWDWS